MAALFALMLTGEAAAVCQQTGWLVEGNITATGPATFVLMPNTGNRIAYTYTTSNERLIGILNEKTQGTAGIRITLVGDAPECPISGLTREAGEVKRIVTNQ